ncbi:MAG: hypothetical protein C4325_12475 [Blastocatellia bacterium]
MYLHEALIIYIAAGSPFAVLRAFRPGSGLSRTARLFLAAAELFIWLPRIIVLAALKAHSYFKNLGNKPDESLDAEICRQVERFYTFYANRPSRFSRSARLFEDYVSVGLSLTEESTLPYTDFFSAAGRDDAKIAAKCLGRRNRWKMERHFRRISSELSDQLLRLLESGDLNEGAVEPIREIAELFGDAKLASLFIRWIGAVKRAA